MHVAVAQQNSLDNYSSAIAKGTTPDRFDVVVVGGFGHVGLPLAVSLAGQGKQVCALDVNATVP